MVEANDPKADNLWNHQPEPSFQWLRWLEQRSSEFSEALDWLREIELTNDGILLANKYACPVFLKSASETEFESIRDNPPQVVQTMTTSTVTMSNDTLPNFASNGLSLSTILKYQPLRLKNPCILELIFYQVICLLESSYNNGVQHFSLQTCDIYLSDDLCVSVLRTSPQIFVEQSECTKSLIHPQVRSSEVFNCEEFHDVLSGWILKKVSNYDYLMYINGLAGRREGDATASAVLPWVTDFSAPTEDGRHLRDLTRTKFRLTKGEHQLDVTYLQNHKGGEGFVPHHLLDMMPNLAYYTYKARQTPVETLQRYVRPVYQPEEFPATLQRLYANTPEECIPEFFSDPTIFTSIHADMSDLKLPEWFLGSPVDFLKYHRDLLESDAVSRNLHCWIDLTFGYKLIGDAAVAAKNVHLELVSPSPPSNSRVTCLFSLPHPRRFVEGDDLIEIYEEMCTFFTKICCAQPPEFAKVEVTAPQPSVDTLLRQNLEDLACLFTEISVGANVQGAIPQLDGVKRATRLERARHLFKAHKSFVPTGFRRFMERVLFDPTWGSFPIGLIRRCIIEVPWYIVDLYRVQIGLSPDLRLQRLDQLHLRDGPPPGALLGAFIGVEEQAKRLDCPVELLELLTPTLHSALKTAPMCLLNSLVSGRLVNFFLVVGGKAAVGKYLLPVIKRLSLSNARLYSRRFIRTLLLSCLLSEFLAVVPDLLAYGLLSPVVDKSPPINPSPSVSVPNAIDTPEDAVVEAFLHNSSGGRDREDSHVPLVAVAQDTFHWLAVNLGPVATARYLVPPLLATLRRCYGTWAGEGLRSVEGVGERPSRLNYRIPMSPLPMPVYTSGLVLRGDIQVPGILRCLERLACLFGTELITNVYLPDIRTAVTAALSTLRSGFGCDAASSASVWDAECEVHVIASLVLLHQLVTYLPAPQLMDHLQEPIILTCLTGALNLAGRLDTGFPSGALGRLALLCKSLDCIYVLGVRLGFEIVRSQMTELIQLLFSLFDRVTAGDLHERLHFFADGDTTDVVNGAEAPHSLQQQQASTSSLFVVKVDRHTSALTVAKEDHQHEQGRGTTSPPSASVFDCIENSSATAAWESPKVTTWQKTAIYSELQTTFTPKMAYVAYTSLCRLAGGSHIESSVYNIDLIHSLVRQYEEGLARSSDGESDLGARSKGSINTEYEAKLIVALNREDAVNRKVVQPAKVLRIHHYSGKCKSVWKDLRLVKELATGIAELVLRETVRSLRFRQEFLVLQTASSSVSKAAPTHLRGEWVEYFRTKLNCETAEEKSSLTKSSSTRRPFSIVGKCLMPFAGHNGAVRSITVLTTENSFITTSNDRCVHLYSLNGTRVASGGAEGGSAPRRSLRRTTDSNGGPVDLNRPTSLSPPTVFGSGGVLLTTGQAQSSSPLVVPSLVFNGHKRPVLASAYLHLDRLVASMDGSSLLLWDPITGKKVSAVTCSDNSSDLTASAGDCGCVIRGSSATVSAGFTALSSAPIYRNTLLAGDETGCLLVIDPRVRADDSVVMRLHAAMVISETTENAVEHLTSPSMPNGLSEFAVLRCAPDRLIDPKLSAAKCAPGSYGSLCSVAARLEDNNSVLCGFSSGLLSNVDLRTGSVVTTWYGHSDSVSQIFSHSAKWFSSVSADHCVVSWRLNQSSITCRRLDHPLTSGLLSCAAQSFSDSLLIAGPITQLATATLDSSPLTTPHSSSSTTLVVSHCDDIGASSSFRPLCSVLLKGGQLSALAALPLTETVVLGTSSGLLNLLF